MRIRRDATFISGVLFTIALVALVPHNLNYASSWHRRFIDATDRWLVPNYFAPIGFAALAFVLVGLIVVWSGYVQRVRWTWFVMFVVVWAYAFPVNILPLFLRTEPINFHAWFWDAVKGNELARDFAKGPLDFLLMVVALFLPIKSFFRKQSANQPGGG